MTAIVQLPLPCKLESTIPIPERVHVRDLSSIQDLSPVLEDVPQRQSYPYNRQSYRQSYYRQSLQPSMPIQSPSKAQAFSEEHELGSKKTIARRYLVYLLVWTILVAVVAIVTGVCVRFA